MTNTNTHKTELPAGWVWTTVGEVYEIVGGGTPSTKIPEYWDGDIPWITSADIHGLTNIQPRKNVTKAGIDNSATNLVPAGSLIVVTRVGLGKLALADKPLCFSQDSQALIDCSNQLNPFYALYFLSDAVQIFKYRNRGTTISGVTKKQLRDLEFALPPLAEQHRIVAKIEELFSDLDHSVAALEQAQAQLKIYRQAVLKYAFEGNLTAQWRQQHTPPPATDLLAQIQTEREARTQQQLETWQTAVEEWQSQGKPGRKPSKPKKPKELPPLTEAELAELPSLPEGWVWVRVEHLLAKSLSNGRSVKTSKDGFPVLRLTALKKGKIDLSEYKIGAWTQEEATPYLVMQGDFLVARGNGSIRLVGRGGLVEDKLEQPVAYPDTLIRVTIHPTICSQKYLQAIWNSRILRAQIEKSARTTAGIYKINQQHLQSFVLSLPPLSEQHAIVEEIEARLSIVDNLEATIDTALQQAQALRQSILKQAFAGKLVPQDPDDEPAGKLLERIKSLKSPTQASQLRMNL